MKQAYLAMRVQQAHKRDAILEGIDVLGYKLETHPEKLKGGTDSLFVTWNLHGDNSQSDRVRKSGGTVIVVENPYIPTDLDGNEYLAMGVNGHNGSGLTPPRAEDRLSRLGVNDLFEPWKVEGQHILVVGQRGIGSPYMRSPPQWGEKVTEKLSQLSHRSVIHRPHPGRVAVTDLPPLQEQLNGAHCIVMWASNCATTALLQGIPVFYCAPFCVLRQACRQGWARLEDTKKDDRARLEAFKDLSYAQWNLDEIRTGEAYERLIECKLLSQESTRG